MLDNTLSTGTWYGCDCDLQRANLFFEDFVGFLFFYLFDEHGVFKSRKVFANLPVAVYRTPDSGVLVLEVPIYTVYHNS
jgi:hypothetical protein